MNGGYRLSEAVEDMCKHEGVDLYSALCDLLTLIGDGVTVKRAFGADDAYKKENGEWMKNGKTVEVFEVADEVYGEDFVIC